MSSKDEKDGYDKKYNEDNFWEKIKSFAIDAGKEVIEKALQLYYVLDKKDVPLSVKTIIYGALAYFVLPLDAIPDMLPVIGYTDDLGVLVSAIAVASRYIDDGVREKAKYKLREWFD